MPMALRGIVSYLSHHKKTVILSGPFVVFYPYKMGDYAHNSLCLISLYIILDNLKRKTYEAYPAGPYRNLFSCFLCTQRHTRRSSKSPLWQLQERPIRINPVCSSNLFGPNIMFGCPVGFGTAFFVLGTLVSLSGGRSAFFLYFYPRNGPKYTTYTWAE